MPPCTSAQHKRRAHARLPRIQANSADYAVALYGSLAAGMTAAQANPALTAGELARQLARTQPRFVAIDGRAWPAVQQALASISNGHGQRPVEAVIGLGGVAGVTPLAELLRSGTVPLASRSPGDDALLFNSSGTSGEPRPPCTRTRPRARSCSSSRPCPRCGSARLTRSGSSPRSRICTARPSSAIRCALALGSSP